MKRIATTAAALAIVIAGCSDAGTSAVDASTTLTATVAPQTDASAAATSTSIAAGPGSTNAPTTAVSTGPSAGDITLPAELVVSPNQGEGPYYPPTKPQDRDNNLLVVDGRSPTPVGTPLEISGLLVYDDGTPVVGATMEIWQVDGQGIYDHPNAPDTANRDVNFQGYGEAVTDADGFWTFLTLDPVLYESRPRHIHSKIKVDGVEVLTTQIYFDGDPLLDGDGLAASAGDQLVLLTTNPEPGTLSNGLDGLVALHLIVLET
jgi:protocatechuate 3,4-dioxygenase beta subunit